MLGRLTRRLADDRRAGRPHHPDQQLGLDLPLAQAPVAAAPMASAPFIVCSRFLRDGMRMRLLADATLMMYGACTYTGRGDAFSASASARGVGAFHPCGLDRKICTQSAFLASAAARGSSG